MAHVSHTDDRFLHVILKMWTCFFFNKIYTPYWNYLPTRVNGTLKSSYQMLLALFTLVHLVRWVVLLCGKAKKHDLRLGLTKKSNVKVSKVQLWRVIVVNCFIPSSKLHHSDPPRLLLGHHWCMCVSPGARESVSLSDKVRWFRLCLWSGAPQRWKGAGTGGAPRQTG